MAALTTRTAIALVALAPSVGCFTHPINRAPVVTSIDPDMPVVRDQPASFAATGYDPDADTFTIKLAMSSGMCDDPADTARWPNMTGTGRLNLAKEQTGAPFCVWAFAKDQYGAVGPFNLFVDPSNLTPRASITLLSPSGASSYPLYSTFALTSRQSTQDDAFTTSWTFVHPSDPMATLSADNCPEDLAADDVRCFQANQSGNYDVRLEVSDGKGASSMDSKSFLVNVDQLPCIEEADPAYDVTVSRELIEPFKVKVSDDGDPYPSSTINHAHFNWFYARDGALLQPVENDYFQLFPDMTGFKPLDSGKVRVEIHDRNRQTIDNLLLSCGNDDFCHGDPQRPGCFQRVTWVVNWR